MSNLLTTMQAAELLGVHDSRIRQLIREGKLPAQQFGRAYLIDPKDAKKAGKRAKPGRPKKK